MNDTAGLTAHFMTGWMRAWQDADEVTVERVVALFAPHCTYRASPFTEAVRREGGRTNKSMIRTQRAWWGRLGRTSWTPGT